MNRDIRFFLNLQILADELIEQYQDIKFYRGQDAQTLEGVYFYNSSRELLSRYVYILKEKDLQSIFPEQHCSLIVLGEIPERWKTGVHSILQLPEETDILDLMNRCQEAFHKHESWAEKLQNIIVQEGSVNELCQISCSYFENPLFVHDSQLQVISCPVWREEMIAWEKDEQTGQLITPLEDLNDFRTNREYLHTLTTEGAHIFSAELRGYRDIYVNIRDDNGTYEGRLVICEIDNPLKPGQFASAEYLAKLIRMVLSRRGHLDIPYKRALYQMLESMVQQTAGADILDITIPAESWTLDESLAPDLEMPGTMPIYPYYADVTVAEAQAGYFPAAALHTESLKAAAAAGMAPVLQALEGKVRFWAKEAPGSALTASLALLSGGKDSAGQGFGVVNVGTALQINVPGGVAGVGEDGKISVSVLPVNTPEGVAGLGADGKVPASLLPETGGGFVQMTEEIPVEQRKPNTMYSLIEVDFG